jgi:hypothetical protein
MRDDRAWPGSYSGLYLDRGDLTALKESDAGEPLGLRPVYSPSRPVFCLGIGQFRLLLFWLRSHPLRRLNVHCAELAALNRILGATATR